MLSPEKSAQLRSLLGTLPPPAAARLARAVEVDKLGGGRVLPHEMILDALRPALRMAPQAARTPTPMRLFCRPFEDLVSERSPKDKVKGRIARASIAPVWSWLEKLLGPAAAAYVAETRGLIVSQDYDAALHRASSFWAESASALRGAIAADRKAARLALGSEAVLGDAEEMALLLGAGPEIVEIQRLLPRPVPELGEEMLWSLREVHDRLLQTLPDAAPYVAVVAMNRLVQPWQALRLPQLVSRSSQDTLISNTDMSVVGDLLFADIEHHGAAVRNARHPMFDVESLIEHLARFTVISSAIVKEIDIRRDGKWGKRLLKDRAAIAETMEGFMERAPKEIVAMLPVQKSGAFGGGPKIADFSKPVDNEKAERGLRYARLVVGCAPYAATGSFAAAQKDALDEASQYLQAYNEDLVREMRGADPARRRVIEHQFELAAALTDLLFSPEEGEFLRRRARAALASAA
ncbi:MAG: hypothetical protein JO261_12785 [Alphaproteobacteria bacterium]|nr:hypothetical protein [Alphaproteobacteria bacterium]MBV9694567.1 hypothetical protein [Alphaproteobacteria bacterium]